MSELTVEAVPGRVEVWTLNRPANRNALTSDMAHRLIAEADRCDDSDAVGAIVLTGAGKAFCAGLDLDEFSRPDAPRDLVGAAIRRLGGLATPLVGAVNGPAVTGGLELALACDALIATPAAVFRDTHLRIGAMSGSGMTVRLPLTVGRGWARRMILAGDPLPAETALGLGLVTDIVPDTELLDSATDLARRMAAMDPPLSATTKQLCDAIERTTPEDGFRLEAEALREHRKKGRAWNTAT
ncbi:enoyl-CoA hydratase-related protein [Rhodococcus sp. B50]|uniref:enoyl-CoA hydratase-related protein n=1 Tax=Rhodococcus sp. B50 TaxID=2682847 RepID=UPI001BD4529C|nr:enoyl-CoA hydratase-related protein [Rhodococcus sp. B50]MBS9376437.1 2,3-dehydroadipyl-CoA hydratase [Rhodococcus sp. B50]